MIDDSNTSNDYSNSFNTYCGYFESGDTVDLRCWTDGGQLVWEHSLCVMPWGVDGNSNVVSEQDDNFSAVEGKDHYYTNFNPSNGLATNTWIRLHSYTFKTKGKYEISSWTGALAKAPGVAFFYNQTSKNGSANSSPPNTVARSLASASQGAGFWYYGSHCTGVQDFDVGNTVDLWAYNRVATNTLTPSFDKAFLSVTPIGLDGQRYCGLDDDNNFVQSESSDKQYGEYSGNTLSNNSWAKVKTFTVTKSGKYYVRSTVTSRGNANTETRYIYNRIAKNSVGASNSLSNSLGTVCKTSQTSYGGSVTQYAGDFVVGDIISVWVYASVAAGTINSVWTGDLLVKPWGGA